MFHILTTVNLLLPTPVYTLVVWLPLKSAFPSLVSSLPESNSSRYHSLLSLLKKVLYPNDFYWKFYFYLKSMRFLPCA